MNHPVPSLFRILSVDYGASLSLLGPVVGWGCYTVAVLGGFMPSGRSYDPLLGVNGLPALFWFATAATVAGVPLGLRRIAFIRSVFERGTAVPGVITAVLFYRDRGRVEYAYTFQDQQAAAANPLMKTARTQTLGEGQPVTVVVDPARPNRGLIRHLYVD